MMLVLAAIEETQLLQLPFGKSHLNLFPVENLLEQKSQNFKLHSSLKC
jgi:hypothetical protein